MNQTESLQHNKVRVHIEGKVYESPDPTTGEALYELGKVPPGYVLYRDVLGPDQLIHRNSEKIDLKPGDNFYMQPAPHQKEFTIIVNGQKKTVDKHKLTFNEVVKLAFDPVPTGPNISFSISYRNGPPANPEGDMNEGSIVKIRDKMVFNVTPTDRS